MGHSRKKECFLMSKQLSKKMNDYIILICMKKIITNLCANIQKEEVNGTTT